MKNVSIIIPYYKKRKFIKKTIDSIKLQSYRNFEVIIIYDDEDRSDLDFINKIIKNDNRMRLIINKKYISLSNIYFSLPENPSVSIDFT